MNYFQRRKVLKAISAEDLVPIRALGHDVVEGKVVILSPKFKNTWVHNLFPRTAKLFYRIKLDDLGSLTWDNISGDKTVSEISAIVQEHLKNNNLDAVDARDRVSKFMSLLYDWRYISFRQIQE